MNMMTITVIQYNLKPFNCSALIRILMYTYCKVLIKIQDTQYVKAGVTFIFSSLILQIPSLRAWY